MSAQIRQSPFIDGAVPIVRAGSAALVGASATLQAFRRALPSLGRSNVHLVITGERGTGKSQWAEAIHRHSERATRSFHYVTLGLTPEARLEQRLFGEPGKEGLLARGRGATLYLAGIDELSPRFQHRLAQWLAIDHPETARVIAGSRTPLDAQVRLGRFSRLLYQRLGLVQLTIAPLRERVEDIAVIAEDHLWQAAEHTSESPLVIRDSALGELAAHGWPENVRELVAVLTSARTDLETRSGSITADLVRKALRRAGVRAASCDVVPLERVEADYIVAALGLCEGNQTLAARRLGIGRSTLLRKLKTSAPRRERAA